MQEHTERTSDDEQHTTMNRVADATSRTEADAASPCQRTDRIRSFVRRNGRMTCAQQLGWTQLFPEQGLLLQSGLLDAETVFGRTAPLIVEIGFGMGESLLKMATDQPDVNFVGIDVHRAGVGSLLYRSRQLGHTNLRVYCDDAVDILSNCLPADSIDRLQVYFPDPWHKLRHHKRRLVNPAFIELLRPRLKRGGTLHMATDWEDYALHMMQVMHKAPGWKNQAGPDAYSARPDWRPLTRFEKKGQQKGHIIRDILFERTD
ncbi:MAG: tRNA (guanosine(46)-N7)-methyltransferase TrmB [Kistimonas sp.]|nr:tRNA (guanosine(46)-N7)-methyltransferase TrmB [Kistimonas sp.]